ncbi:hypothetical protein GCM10009603_63910 [Nocardiopsis exhalans]
MRPGPSLPKRRPESGSVTRLERFCRRSGVVSDRLRGAGDRAEGPTVAGSGPTIRSGEGWNPNLRRFCASGDEYCNLSDYGPFVWFYRKCEKPPVGSGGFGHRGVGWVVLGGIDTPDAGNLFLTVTDSE